VLEDDRNAILAIGMNGDPLPAEHGFPVRMVVPGLYGYVSATKWVVDLEVHAVRPGHRVLDGSRLERARTHQDLVAHRRAPLGPGAVGGTIAVAGVAWHQHVGIESVDVQVDDGPWQPATLATAISIDTWVQWRFDWDAPSGTHTLRVRATGADGEVQTSDLQGPVPDGSTGLDERTVDVT
jgi:DMSO/TMAO reductase YedYZ molybdopterin-dependent catalytic subunit